MIHPNVFVFNFLILLIPGWVVAASHMAEKTNVGMAGAPGRTVLRTDEVLLGKYDIINK